MTNLITIELCAEDRARLDRLAAALEQRATHTEGITLDPIQQRLSATIEAAEKSTVAEEETLTPTTITPVEEAPTEEKNEPLEPVITKDQIQQKVIQLCAKADKKAKAREIVNSYAPNISGIPEDKLGEVWSKLTALESEA